MKPFALLCLALAFACVLGIAQAAAPSPATVAAGDIELQCPAALAQAPVADRLPAGWVVHGTPGELPLQRAAFYDGDPVGLATLAPEATHRSGLTETSTWRFDAEQSTHVWLGCLYRGATAVVARPLPSGVHQCAATLRLTSLGDPAGPLSVRCR
jgi:hypothetical protein